MFLSSYHQREDTRSAGAKAAKKIIHRVDVVRWPWTRFVITEENWVRFAKSFPTIKLAMLERCRAI